MMGPHVQQLISDGTSPDHAETNSPARYDQETEGQRSNASYRVCDNCQKRRRKCNLERPSCSFCLTSHMQCTYSSRKRKPGPRKGHVSRRTAAPPSRLESIENLLKAQRATSNVETVNDATSHQDISPTTLVSVADDSSTPKDDSSLNPWYTGPTTLNDTTVFQGRMARLAENSLSSPFIECTQVTQHDQENLQAQILSLYFEHIQPIVPIFRKSSFYEEYKNGGVPRDLLAVMLALAAPYSMGSEHCVLSTMEYWQVKAVSPVESLQGISNRERTRSITMNEVRTALLTTFYHYARLPGRNAWAQMGVLTRLAYGCGLHQVDSPSNSRSMSEEEREERRYLWWSISKLDTHSNCIASTPFLIDPENVCTFLVSTPIDEFTEGKTRASTQTLLDSGPGRVEQLFQAMQSEDLVDAQNAWIMIDYVLREASTILRRLSQNPTSTIRNHHFTLLNICSSIGLTLPTSYLHPARNTMRNETATAHRLRLETLLLLHIVRILATLPVPNHRMLAVGDVSFQENALQSWQACISQCEEIVCVFQHWDPCYFSQVDPVACSTVWSTCCLLSLQSMHLSIDAAAKARLESALDLLSVSLQQFARYWPIAGAQLQSIKRLRTWSFLKISFSDLLILLMRFQVPVDPDEESPTDFRLDPIVYDDNSNTAAERFPIQSAAVHDMVGQAYT